MLMSADYIHIGLRGIPHVYMRKGAKNIKCTCISDHIKNVDQCQFCLIEYVGYSVQQ